MRTANRSSLPVVAAAAFALAATLAAALAATLAAEEKKPIATKQTRSITATVEAIDKANRELTLKGPKGNLVVVEVSERVKRFDEIKVGDIISAQYTEALVFQLKKAEESAPLGTVEKVGGTPTEGDKPGAVVSSQVTATVAVEAVDPSVPSITVRNAENNILSYRVENAKNLEGVKPGDKIVVTYIEALAIQVSEPKKK
jgi:Cu/Ag efflux protein CusF